jgi:hypothetical protein
VLRVPKAEVQQIFNIFCRAVTHMKTAAEALGTRKVVASLALLVSILLKPISFSVRKKRQYRRGMFDIKDTKDGGAGDSSCLMYF